MSGTPRFKIYDDQGIYQAATRDATLAAVVVGVGGFDGWTVKVNGRIVWRQGSEEFSAADSYDDAAMLIYDRIEEHHRQRMARFG